MNDDDKMIEDQPITMGQPLSDFLLQLEDYTPTVIQCLYTLTFHCLTIF